MDILRETRASGRTLGAGRTERARLETSRGGSIRRSRACLAVISPVSTTDLRAQTEKKRRRIKRQESEGRQRKYPHELFAQFGTGL